MKKLTVFKAILISGVIILSGCSSAPDPYTGPTPTESVNISSSQKCS